MRGIFFFLQKLLFHVIESSLNFNFSTLRVISSLSGKSIGERAIKPYRCFEGAREGDGWDSASQAFLRRLSQSLFSPPPPSILTPRLLFFFFRFLQTLSSLSPLPSLRLPLPDAYHIPLA